MSETSPKRKRSSSSATSTPVEDNRARLKKQTMPNPPPIAALPPPLIPYPTGHYIVQQPYYAMYPQTPIYFPISPHQHPYSVVQDSSVHSSHDTNNNNNNNNNNNSSNNNHNSNPNDTGNKDSSNNTSNHSGNVACILPKGNAHDMVLPVSSPPYPQPFYHPYPILSQTMHTTTAADVREQARKVSHSAIEKRRRERINDKIMQLKELIPNCAAQENLHKMSILQSAIDYITYLKEIVKNLEDNETSSQLLKGEHLKVKPARSMLPKEVEPFTTQFSVHSAIIKTGATASMSDDGNENESQEESENSIVQQHQRSDMEQLRGLKPIDVIQSSTPLIIDSKAPLTPPQEPTECDIINNKTNHQNNNNNTKPNETKHMSLSNILC